MSEISEKELVDLLKSGDKESFKILYKANIHEVYNYIVNRVEDRNEDDAQDLTQEVFTRCFRMTKHFEGRSSFRTWLIGIAKNVLMEYKRKIRPEVKVKGKKEKLRVNVISIDEPIMTNKGEKLQIEIKDNCPIPEQVFAEKEKRALLLRALDQLTKEEKDVTILRLGINRELGSLSIRQTAVYLNKSNGAVKMALDRAMDKLQRFLDPTDFL